MSRPRILLIDEDSQDRALAVLVLARDLEKPAIVEVGTANEFTVAVSRGAYDVVVTEQSLSWSEDIDVIETLRESRSDVPILVFTKTPEVETAVRAMRAGVFEYIVKSSKGFLILGSAVREALERVETEHQIARSEPWLQTLLDRANVGVFRSTLDERLIEANPAVLRLLGVGSLKEALEVDLPTHFLGTEGGRADLLQRLNSEGELQARVVELERPDGTKVWLNLTEVLLLDVDGDIVVDVLIHDISHLQQGAGGLQVRLQELERSNEDLSSFASMAAHELKAPLRTVGKYTELLKADLAGDLPQKAKESLEFVHEGARNMQRLVDGLLEFSRVSAEWRGFQACDCNTLVNRALRSLQPLIEESGAMVRRQGLPTILGDADELEHVFQNLLSNALKFRSEKTPEISISVNREEESYVFSVQDNGIGIDPRDGERIFKVFSRLHPDRPGSGIGLALCRRIVERHGGRIWVESSPGGGAVFSFAIPINGDRSDEPGQTNLVKRTTVKKA
ncbi:MAG: response regulator [bacterium]|nr:response regulator [bacterium]